MKRLAFIFMVECVYSIRGDFATVSNPQPRHHIL
jgi:hypothetical protein